MSAQTFFHVSRLGKLPAKLSLDGKVPDFAALRTDNYFNEKQYQEAIDRFLPNGISKQGENYLFKPLEYFKINDNENSVTYSPVIEMVFELVRQLHFANLPSRYASLFAWKTIEEAYEFIKYHGGNHDCIIYKISACNFFKADMNLVRLGYSAAAGYTIANSYWKGIASENPKWEYLLSYPIQIIDEVL